MQTHCYDQPCLVLFPLLVKTYKIEEKIFCTYRAPDHLNHNGEICAVHSGVYVLIVSLEKPIMD